MKVYLSKYLIIALLILNFTFCKKKSKVVAEPSIELIETTPTNVKEFVDQIEVTIKYKDENGDIGDENPDELSFEVKDARLAKADYYHIKPLAPISSKDISIQGTLKLKLNNMFLLGSGTKETTTLTIKLKDRAGHWSNEVVTSEITINK